MKTYLSFEFKLYLDVKLARCQLSLKILKAFVYLLFFLNQLTNTLEPNCDYEIYLV